jgi:hypothetical protein
MYCSNSDMNRCRIGNSSYQASRATLTDEKCIRCLCSARGSILEGLYTNMAGSQKAGKRPPLSKFLSLFYCPPRQEPCEQLFASSKHESPLAAQFLCQPRRGGRANRSSPDQPCQPSSSAIPRRKGVAALWGRDPRGIDSRRRGNTFTLGS